MEGILTWASVPSQDSTNAEKQEELPSSSAVVLAKLDAELTTYMEALLNGDKSVLPSLNELGLFYYELEEYPRATVCWVGACENDYIPSMLHLSRLKMKLSLIQGAYDWSCKAAQKGDPRALKDLNAFGKICYDENDFRSAKGFWEAADFFGDIVRHTI